MVLNTNVSELDCIYAVVLNVGIASGKLEVLANAESTTALSIISTLVL